MDERAEARLRKAADRVLHPLERLVREMATMEPGAVVDDAEFTRREGGMTVAYKARPISVAFVGGGKRIVVRVEPLPEKPPTK
jgi:hypothetical protein